MNPENKKQIIVVAVLAVVLLGVLLWQFVLRPAEGPPMVEGQTKVAKVSTTTTKTPVEAPKTLVRVEIDVDALLREIEVVTFDYDAERIDRQPMRPLVKNEGINPTDPDGMTSALPSLVRQMNVSAIVWDEVRPVAVVDDAFVWEGKTYPGGIVVETIERNRVWFKIANQRIPVDLDLLK